MQLSVRSVVLLLACWLLTSLGVISCGEVGATGSTTTSMTLNVGQISDSVAFFPFYVAEQQKYFKDEGLTLASRPRLGTGAKVATALVAGSIDIGGGVITDAFDLAKVDPQVKIIGSLVNGYYVDVTVSKSFERATGLTASSPLANKVNALRGKKIGITGPGSGTEALMIYLFKLQGLDVKRDATLVNLGSDNTAALAALRAGRVDALCFFSPVGQAAELQGIGDILISPMRGDIPAMRGQLHGIFYTLQSVINARPEAIQAFIRAVGRAEAYIHAHPDKALILLENYLHMNPQIARAVFTAMAPAYPRSPRIDSRGYSIAAQFHVQAGLISTAPFYNSIVATSTIDAALGKASMSLYWRVTG
jgi:NitT/TauT family transport system substrate-binding protein